MNPNGTNWVTVLFLSAVSALAVYATAAGSAAGWTVTPGNFWPAVVAFCGAFLAGVKDTNKLP